jgi:cell division septal protein FtsQ
MRSISAPADRRFRRAHVKPSGRRTISGRRLLGAAKIASILGLAVYGGWRGTAIALSAPALQVSRITVRGNERLATGEVLAILDGLRGRNILKVRLDEWRKRLIASPWVDEVTLRRILPSEIDVLIQERRPIGIARLSGNLYLVDAEGIVIDQYGPSHADFDLPVIDGLASRPSQSTGIVDERRASFAARVIAALQARPDLARLVSQIDVSDAHDAVVILEGDTTMLRLGEQDFIDRIQQYIDLAPALRERLAELDYVDLRFSERLYVRPASIRKR